jgi:alpha-ketoglutarate-dependent taurine dioxygenase
MRDAGSDIEFPDATTRLLEDHERPFGSVARALPLVVEPRRSSSASALHSLLASSSGTVEAAVYDHGAVLFRGYAVATERDFQTAIHSLRGARPVQRYFMMEKGRSLVPGTDSVFVTNQHYKTGGGFSFNGFHSENFYNPDVPALQSFWCKTEPVLGGESGLIHMADGFAELPASVRATLERAPIAARAWPIAEVAAHYGLTERRVDRFFDELGSSGVLPDGTKVVAIDKPAVFLHPHHGKRSLQVNFGSELTRASGLLQHLLRSHYAEPRWMLHRYAWAHPFMLDAFEAIERMPYALAHPTIVGKQQWEAVKGLAKGAGARFGLRSPSSKAAGPRASTMLGRDYHPPFGRPKLADLLTGDEHVLLAKAARKHCSVFTWKKGDVLLFDNLQVLHAGMPGLGPRELRVVMCNLVPMSYPFSSGLLEVHVDESYRSFDDRLRALA